MKAGVVYPQIELGGDTGAVKAFAQAAEDLGYDHVVIYDHVLGAVHAGREPELSGPYKETDPFHEPLVTYAYLAGVTKKTRIGHRCDHPAAAANGPVRQTSRRC
jgi:alkanesulfonate monooxygenase SsuD/methylene tetrahydromethanopterin reductase-like flavin-dependent oxidoreductase (luciferase family)